VSSSTLEEAHLVGPIRLGADIVCALMSALDENLVLLHHAIQAMSMAFSLISR